MLPRRPMILGKSISAWLSSELGSGMVSVWYARSDSFRRGFRHLAEFDVVYQVRLDSRVSPTFRSLQR